MTHHQCGEMVETLKSKSFQGARKKIDNKILHCPGLYPQFFFCLRPGLPAGSGVLASQGDQPKKGGIFFFFSMILICVVCSINADATLRYAPLRTLSGQKKFSTSAKMSRQTVKTAALTRILHIISRSPPLRNKKKYVRSVACRRFLV